jgi:hypothetical protein
VFEVQNAEAVRAMLTNRGVRAEIVMTVTATELPHPLVWVPAQDYERAADLVARMTHSTERGT